MERFWLLKVAWVMEDRAQEGIHSGALRGCQSQEDPNGHEQGAAESMMVHPQWINNSFILCMVVQLVADILSNFAPFG